ncbi:hypothetical protein NM688_g1924 [Phlebia brevispora]|uniref:Uncharacterized protein n=1 Tax=Phlebia brevispora TaxID=194682 RepID=A0ACC1TAB8_9APHY|nr:hypothetical protein NM688_g1924 [Phlebia brevispora]
MPLSPASKESVTSARTSHVDNASVASARSLSDPRGIQAGPSIARDGESSHRDVTMTSASSGRGPEKMEVHRNTPLRPLLPSSGSKRTSHLPTPQSPNSVGAYADSLANGSESPVRKGRYNPGPSSPEERTRTPPPCISHYTGIEPSLCTEVQNFPRVILPAFHTPSRSLTKRSRENILRDTSRSSCLAFK